MDFEAHKRDLIAWYAFLGGMPAWKAHAWHQVNELAKLYPDLYGDMPALLTARMKGLQC